MITEKGTGGEMLSSDLKRLLKRYVLTRNVADGIRLFDRAEAQGAARSEIRSTLHRGGIPAIMISALEKAQFLGEEPAAVSEEEFLKNAILETASSYEKLLALDEKAFFSPSNPSPSPAPSIDRDEGEIDIEPGPGGRRM